MNACSLVGYVYLHFDLQLFRQMKIGNSISTKIPCLFTFEVRNGAFVYCIDHFLGENRLLILEPRVIFLLCYDGIKNHTKFSQMVINRKWKSYLCGKGNRSNTFNSLSTWSASSCKNYNSNSRVPDCSKNILLPTSVKCINWNLWGHISAHPM